VIDIIESKNEAEIFREKSKESSWLLILKLVKSDDVSTPNGLCNIRLSIFNSILFFINFFYYSIFFSRGSRLITPLLYTLSLRSSLTKQFSLLFSLKILASFLLSIISITSYYYSKKKKKSTNKILYPNGKC
jgi:hypothetical protein